jgi:hypothetical protein
MAHEPMPANAGLICPWQALDIRAISPALIGAGVRSHLGVFLRIRQHFRTFYRIKWCYYGCSDSEDCYAHDGNTGR